MNTNAKEPAPAATDTSSNMKNEINSQHKDSILSGKCQEAIEDACKQLLNIYQDMPFEPHLTPLRLARYLDDHGISGSDYGDYVVECLKLGLDMRDTAISMPNDFMKVHTRFSMIVEYKIDALHIARFDKRLAERAVLEFSSDDLIVRQPLSMEEIVYEGKVLGHCVGGYAERHANGVLHILFIRSRDKPDKPFYTMELSTDGRVMQVRGLKNADPTKEVKVLISAYKEYLKTIFTNHRRKTA